ncbi:MAG: PilZ domain-containing protein [Pirellulaceae bacterium]
MLNHTSRAANWLIEKTVQNMEAETSRYLNSERRTLFRTPFARPVSVRLRDCQQSIKTTSQNISETGVALLSEATFNEKDIGVLTVHSLEGRPTVFLAECQWCRPFGEGWYLSGWHFISVQGNQRKQK